MKTHGIKIGVILTVLLFLTSGLSYGVNRILEKSFVETVQTEAQKFDEYGKIRPKDEQARLSNLAVAMKGENAATRIYIINYGGRTSVKGEAKKMGAAAKTYLTKKRRIAAARITVVDGGYKEEATTELWTVPQGATAPYASPSVDPSEVSIKSPAKSKGKAGKKKKAKNQTSIINL